MKMKKGLIYQTFAVILTAAMIFSVCLPVLPAHAEEDGGSFCIHHPDHTAECGYDQSTPEQSCTYQVNGCPYCVTVWQWEDLNNFLTQGTDGWELDMPGVSADNPLAKSDLEGILPVQIQATTGSGDVLSLGIAWDLSGLPDSLTEGTYSLTASLTETEENYSLTDGTTSLAITLRLGGAQTLDDDKNGTVADPTETPPYKDYVIEPSETYTPGTVINLFDYWLTERTDPDNSDPANAKDTGINKDYYLTFRISSIEGDWDRWTGAGNWPRTDIVKNQLGTDGYPVFDQTQTNPDYTESLSYLFDSKDSAYKKAFSNVGGLLQVDEDGYYYYSSQKNFAWFNERTNNFVLYNTWGVKKGGSSPDGQFFPFNYPKNLFTATANGLQASNITSQNPTINHYFGLTMTTRFVQKNGGTIYGQKPVTYNFSGDDDVWIFIDDVLVADLGGIHDMCNVQIDFQTGEIIVYKDKDGGTINQYDEGTDEKHSKTTLRDEFEKVLGTDNLNAKDWNNDTFADDTYHTLKFFYLERGNTDSNMSLKFNLIPIPESEITKVDQRNGKLENVNFELYPATRSQTPDENGDYSYTVKSGYENTPNWTGTTNEEGELSILDKESHSPLTFKDFYEQTGAEYFILRETNVPDGYRKIGDTYLQYIPDTGLILADNHWTTGAYAQPKITTTATTTIYEANDDGSQGEAITVPVDPDELTMFAVVFKRLDMNEPVDDQNNWAPVSGNAEDGWTVWDDTTVSLAERIKSAAEANAMDGEQNKFKLTTGGSLQVTLENLPGDITKYYWYLKQQAAGNTDDAEYTVNYYYMPNNGTGPVRLYTDDFDREFSTHVYIPNTKNYLLVQKVDEYGTPVDGATFSLYKAEDVTVDSTTGQYTISNGAQAYAGIPHTVSVSLSHPVGTAGRSRRNRFGRYPHVATRFRSARNG